MSRTLDRWQERDLLPLSEHSFNIDDPSRELEQLLESHESAITTIEFRMDELCGALECAKMEMKRIAEERENLDDLEDSVRRLRFRPEDETPTLWAGTLQHDFFTRTFAVSPSDEGYDWAAPSASVPIPAEFLTSMTQTSLVEPKRSDKIPSNALEWTLHRIAYEVNIVHGVNACMTYVQSRSALAYTMRRSWLRLANLPDSTVISRHRNRRPRVRFVVLERDKPMSSAVDTELLAYLRFGHDTVTILWKIFIEARHVERHPWGWRSDEDSSGTESGSGEHVPMKE
ncbi:hypothetical protein ASPACDRAFT_56871 [Aspergillus aculeatus ATCC 16872]|uniref:Uncharacterized protein n=1 Tax=Aspergillus aculeatus (strain ATCC 16872 / CBS 172.66 / WB 5094) TaxID=690307 RepID=A0A1L9X564_ASPA1|nr:uncharacterized protein ASPACDRAFT_56871 [Aspergillus aculeatus ATCC 16872]OJK03464.1 hypothetical protein ASPACDRAFT_56871 [Aspergillus aculeatus ATCC 16872]